MVSGAGVGGGVGGAGVPPTASALGRPGIGSVPSSSASGAGTSRVWGGKVAPYSARAQEQEQREQREVREVRNQQRQRETRQRSDGSAHVGSSPTRTSSSSGGGGGGGGGNSGLSGGSSSRGRGSSERSSGIGSGGTEAFGTPPESPSGSDSYQHRPKRQFAGRSAEREGESPGERGLSAQGGGREGARSGFAIGGERPVTSRQLFGGKGEAEGEGEGLRRRKQAGAGAGGVGAAGAGGRGEVGGAGSKGREGLAEGQAAGEGRGVGQVVNESGSARWRGVQGGERGVGTAAWATAPPPVL
ncbi:unnamed protein product, partial [Closterium sp. Naga37s-1]